MNMPKKVFYTKEYIAGVALQLLREEGIQNLTARAVAKRTGCSVCPIFSAFENMEELQRAVIAEARKVYDSYVDAGLSKELAFKGVGEAYIRFAANEPKLFQLLFMNDDKVRNLNTVLPSIDLNYKKILQSITDGYAVSEKTAFKLYKNLWIFTHGIAAMCATRTCEFSGKEIDEMMTDVFKSLLVKYKGEEND